MNKLLYILAKSNDLPPLMMRILMSYVFIKAGLGKLNDIDGTIYFFKAVGIVLPEVAVYFVLGLEILGGILIGIGYFTRISAFLLTIVMIFALRTVHFGNGFSAVSNGIEIPMYCLVMLVSLVIYGAGNVSIDFFNSLNKEKK